MHHNNHHTFLLLLRPQNHFNHSNGTVLHFLFIDFRAVFVHVGHFTILMSLSDRN